MANLSVLDGNLAVQALSALADADGSLTLVRTSEHRKPTFRYAGTFTPVATPTDVLMIQGSATKTLRIKRIALGGVATANGNMPAQLIRRSTQFTTQGSAVFTAITAGKHDTTDAAATGVVSTIGTANLTSVGTLVANVGQGRLFLPTTATGTPSPLVWDFATRQDKPLILRGVLDFLFINLVGAAVPAGGVIDYEIEIEEDAS
jgi:hypothetical protein